MAAKRTVSSTSKKAVAGRTGAKKAATKKSAATSLTRARKKSGEALASGGRVKAKAHVSIKEPRARVRTVEKISLTVPTIVMERVRERAPAGEVSAYVSQAVQRQLERDALSDLLAQMEAENGPVSDAEVEKALALWPDA